MTREFSCRFPTRASRSWEFTSPRGWTAAFGSAPTPSWPSSGRATECTTSTWRTLPTLSHSGATAASVFSPQMWNENQFDFFFFPLSYLAIMTSTSVSECLYDGWQIYSQSYSQTDGLILVFSCPAEAFRSWCWRTSLMEWGRCTEGFLSVRRWKSCRGTSLRSRWVTSSGTQTVLLCLMQHWRIIYL